ncbi:MAG: hypothetical protein P4M14_08385 [Gammaproteobacteria bacterium]|nr:hypothetical protein [Gammaproteobacteria bacterium]
MLIYRVAKKYSKGPEQVVARFNDIKEAKIYINQQLQADIALKVVTSYLLYDMGDLIETLDQSSVSGVDDSGGQQAGSGQRFSPSPLQTNPRPGGMPPSSFKDEDDHNK